MKTVIALFLIISSHAANAQQFIGPKSEIDKIITASKAFSEAYVKGDMDKMVNTYTTDGKIFPGGTEILEGHDRIRKQWALPAGDKITSHVATPTEIRILEDHAYDYGYYEGETMKANGEIQKWKGKYVIVWRKEKGNWLMYLDIWNRVL
jgi:ketosteroid isomerase-like protein